ncbi:DUF975 family protein [Peptoniphilus catoniae]|uniref:DUF975 family protein n=1 Tax=Peptoniphilus catoniae TaxID=1660341 RepID=UPI0010FCE59C|nr:DUF975 family protein [Peptoniphilus catoniae]
MWTRKFLKDNAKEFLRRYLKDAIVVCLIFYLLSSLFGSDNSFDNMRVYTMDEFKKEYRQEEGREYNIQVFKGPFIYSKNIFGDGFWMSKSPFTEQKLVVSDQMFFVLSLISLLVNIFVLGPLKVGLNKYFIKGYKYDSNIKYLISPFAEGKSLKISGKIVLKNIYIVLWSLLLVIPGIIKGYEYYFVEYIFAENPDMSLEDAINLSKELTKDDKFNIFILEFSFIGWAFLSALTFNLGFILLNPYMEATRASLYIVKKKAFQDMQDNMGSSDFDK